MERSVPDGHGWNRSSGQNCMLATLETGIEGGKWFRLIDKVWSPKNLGRSLQKVVARRRKRGNRSAKRATN